MIVIVHGNEFNEPFQALAEGKIEAAILERWPFATNGFRMTSTVLAEVGVDGVHWDDNGLATLIHTPRTETWYAVVDARAMPEDPPMIGYLTQDEADRDKVLARYDSSPTANAEGYAWRKGKIIVEMED